MYRVVGTQYTYGQGPLRPFSEPHLYKISYVRDLTVANNPSSESTVWTMEAVWGPSSDPEKRIWGCQIGVWAPASLLHRYKSGTYRETPKTEMSLFFWTYRYLYCLIEFWVPILTKKYIY